MAFDKIVDHLVAAGHGSRKRCRVKARSLIDAFDQLGTTAELLEQFGDDAADDVDVPDEWRGIDVDDAHEQSEREED